MDDVVERVRKHYEAAGTDVASKIAAYLADIDGSISAEAVAGIDQFHMGGLAATRELGRRLDLKPDMAVLDAGSGLGGPSRELAAIYDCSVTGVDLAPGFVAASRLIAARSNLGDRVRYEVGDLTALRFADATFDAAYTQHVVMNIPDRENTYREVRRVLKPGASFGCYDVLAADDKPEPHYPVPWAEDAATCFLLTEAETRTALETAGFVVAEWSDVTALAMGWATQQQMLPTSRSANLGMVMGPRMAGMAANFMRNLGEGRLRLVMAVWTAI
jgi:ubiquinone/menaquinone biosynthesis C-methylase UbiE